MQNRSGAALVNARIWKLTAGVHDARTELAKVQFELNLKITELDLRAQPLTPPEVKEQREATIKNVVTTVDAAVNYCTALFEQLLEVFSSLQEDPNLQRLDIELRELQQRYDEVKATACTVTLT